MLLCKFYFSKSKTEFYSDNQCQNIATGSNDYCIKHHHQAYKKTTQVQKHRQDPSVRQQKRHQQYKEAAAITNWPKVIPFEYKLNCYQYFRNLISQPMISEKACAICRQL